MNNAAQLVMLLTDLVSIVQSGQAILTGPLFRNEDITDEQLKGIVNRTAGSINNLRAVIRAKKEENNGSMV